MAGLLKHWRRVFRVLTALFWMKPEDFIPSKMVSVGAVAAMTVLYVDWKAGFRGARCLEIAWSTLMTLARAAPKLSLMASKFCRDLVLWMPISPKQKHYKHQDDAALQLGEIRLLRLNRWLPFLGVRAYLYPVKLENQPVYEAISYTWGTSKEQREISINGKPFITSAATYDALYSHSSMWRSRVLWIDYVCIDQSKLEEKGEQVNMMTEIYLNASRVVVWLGESTNARLAVSLLHEMANIPPGVDLYRLYEESTLSIRWQALIEFFSHPWFTRVWIVQEVAVANNVVFIYGRLTFSLETLKANIEVFRDPQMSGLLHQTRAGHKAIGNLNHLGTIAKIQQRYNMTSSIRKSLKTLRVANAIMRLLQKVSDSQVDPDEVLDQMLKPLSLQFLLTDCGTFEATDPRDKIFAFTGLATDEKNMAFAPDYTKPVEEVYTNVVKYFLTGKEPFCVISCAGIGGVRNLDLPSWVPDWSLLPQSAPFTTPRYRDELVDFRFSASRKTQAQVSCTTDLNILKLGAMIVDEIAALGMAFDTHSGDDAFVMDEAGNLFPPQEWINTFLWYEKAFRLAKERTTQYGDDDAIEQAFWRTLIGDQVPMTRPAPDILFQDYKLWVEHLKYNDLLARDFLAGRIRRLPLDEAYWRRMQETATWGSALGSCSSTRKFAVMRNGYMGIVPPLSEVGDVVSIVLGARTPLLLRRSRKVEEFQKEGKLFELVGECYVHGMMDGEMVDEGHEVEELWIV